MVITMMRIMISNMSNIMIITTLVSNSQTNHRNYNNNDEQIISLNEPVQGKDGWARRTSHLKLGV